jgi:hypothetical protein
MGPMYLSNVIVNEAMLCGKTKNSQFFIPPMAEANGVCAPQAASIAGQATKCLLQKISG